MGSEREEGYQSSRDDGVEPDAVGGQSDAVGIEPLRLEDATPTTVASRIGHALERDRRVLFVVGDGDAESAVRDLLAEPPLVVADDGGRRTFHSGPDRITVQVGGYACVHRPNLPEPEFVWRETDTPVGPVPSVAGVDPEATGADGRPAVPRLVCEVGGRPVVVLAGVESLATPPAAAVPFRYHRDPTDKQFRVVRGDDGSVVETCGGFSAFRRAGYHPVPMPLVPEHVFGADVDVASRCALLRVDGEPRFVAL